jgi:hypothetical protein
VPGIVLCTQETEVNGPERATGEEKGKPKGKPGSETWSTREGAGECTAAKVPLALQLLLQKTGSGGQLHFLSLSF